jgi:ABC-2 type transport system ATP-binding protein
MTAALETTGLGKRYRRTWALRDCTLAVPRGRVAALVGPNGAGKTTLLHLAVGLIGPTTGTIRLLGQPSGGAGLLERVGFVAQDAPLYRDFTVADLLTLGRKLNRRFDDRLASERLGQLGIPLDRRVGSLSGGQHAQVALVLAIAKRPELLLLDEPLASLDPGGAAAVAPLIGRGCGKTRVLISHDAEQGLAEADWVLGLRDGRQAIWAQAAGVGPTDVRGLYP